MSDLLLIRHATNDWVGQRLAGHTAGVHLNAEGQRQAVALAERLTDWPLAAIYSSPLERARETAQPLAEHRKLSVVIENGLAEVAYGAWTGQTLQDLAKTPQWPQVQHTPSLFVFPEGEAMGAMQARAVAAIERLRLAHAGQVIALVSHADVIKAAVAYYIGMPFDLFQRLVVDTASLTWLHFTANGPYLLRFNDTGALHLPQRKAAHP